MNNLDKQFQSLLKDILDNGVTKSDRTGTGTKSVFSRTIRHNMSEGFPLLTTKRMGIKTISTELKWFLKGDTNIKFLVDNNCHIWNGDAYTNYLKIHSECIDGLESQEEFINKIKTDDEFAKKWGELGPVYGAQWRNWNNFGYNGDQITNLLHELKDNPDSRRLMVNAWNVEQLDEMVLPPCHYGFQVYTRELSLTERIDIHNKSRVPMNQSDDYFHEHMDGLGIPQRTISLMWNQRSVDTFLGLPFNIASYGLLLILIASEVNMIPENLIGNLGDTHLYLNHLEQAEEQVLREPFKLPKIEILETNLLQGEFEFNLVEYQSHSQIKAFLSN